MKKLLWKQNAQCTQSAIIDMEIEEVKDFVAGIIKVSKSFHVEFLILSVEAEKMRNSKLLSTGNALKIKSQEKQNEASTFEGALQVLQEKRRKVI